MPWRYDEVEITAWISCLCLQHIHFTWKRALTDQRWTYSCFLVQLKYNSQRRALTAVTILVEADFGLQTPDSIVAAAMVGEGLVVTAQKRHSQCWIALSR